MTKRIVLLLAALIAPSVARAQIEVSCRLEHERVLAFEPIRVTVGIVNNTGRSLLFSEEGGDARLAFDIEQTPGAALRPTGEPIFPEPFSLEPGKQATKTVNLLSVFPIGSTGPYTIRARVEWAGRMFSSPGLFLDILPGLEIGHLTAGVPGEAGALRTYTLRTLNRDRSEHVFLRIEDEDEGQCYGVFDLGRIVRVTPPSLQVDSAGNVHVLHQAAPRQYTHSAFRPNGEPVEQKQYLSGALDVRMRKSDDGEVRVSGSAIVEAPGLETPDDTKAFIPPGSGK